MRAGAVLTIAVVCGCTTTTSAVRPDDKLDPGFAYLYGRFFIRSDEQPGSLPGHQSIGLRLQCTDHREYGIWFSTARDVQVLQVHPSRCAFTGGSYTDQDGFPHGNVNVPPANRRVQEFAAGKAYYLGDYFARGVFELTEHVGYNNLFWSWAMDPADDRYETTTIEMRRTFHNLASLATEDKRLIPAKPAPKRGAVVITDPKEPPMTPERIARVAPFIKRSYQSPAACEAACPTGQCLPFRGDAGPAMTCIVRCNTDKDCPAGLACNCPNPETPESPDCHPIATTPTDGMARICLAVEPAGQQPPR